MKKLITLFLVFAFAFTSFLGNTYATNAVPIKVMNARNSVVRIIAEYTTTFSSGSGFVILCNNKTTLIATNYHVVEGNALTISVLLGDNETISAHILAYSDQKDICVLELAYPISMNALTLNNEGVSQGDPVYAVGYPSAADSFSETIAQTSEEATITDGIVSATRKITTTNYSSQ
jgi:S1-C subfamily serine protease